MVALGTIVLYRTDGRNDLHYDLPAIVTCTPESHPGDYPDGRRNPLPVPDPGCVHLTVFTPGGYGTKIATSAGPAAPVDDSEFVDAPGIIPGSGTYVEWNVPQYPDLLQTPDAAVPPRTFRLASLGAHLL